MKGRVLRGGVAAGLLWAWVFGACGVAAQDAPAPGPGPQTAPDRASQQDQTDPAAPRQAEGAEDLELYDKIRDGSARLAELRQALTNPEVGQLVNIVHAAYSMRWQRPSVKFLLRLWEQDKSLQTQYPNLAWRSLDKTPVRLALASTLLRIQAPGQEQYVKYLLEHRYDKHEFHRAQVVIGLGLNGNPDDVDYLLEMADGDNHYVVQTAIAGLGLMRGERAKRGLGELWKKHRGSPRGQLIENVLSEVYRVTPHVEGEEETPPQAGQQDAGTASGGLDEAAAQQAEEAGGRQPSASRGNVVTEPPAEGQAGRRQAPGASSP